MAPKSEDRFTRAIINTLAKRAANRCSNPDCGAITSGPSDKPTAAVNVGEAAHIYGAHPGSARYEATMSSAARSDITNGVWLCANCHKMIDDDEGRYPAGLLFEWVKQHEGQVAIQVGKAGAEARKRYEGRHIEELGKLSYSAERIISERPDLWEYRLTEEVLRFEMAPVLQRWRALKNGLYTRPISHIPTVDFHRWIMTRQDEVMNMVEAFDRLMHEEFSRSWGEPGVAGNDQEIVFVSRLYAEMCATALAWEERVKFATTDEPFDKILALYVGLAGGLIDEAAKLPVWMANTFSQENLTGVQSFTAVLTLPEGCAEAVRVAWQSAAATSEGKD